MNIKLFRLKKDYSDVPMQDNEHVNYSLKNNYKHSGASKDEIKYQTAPKDLFSI